MGRKGNDTMTNITIQHSSEINANGQKRNGNATPVICITTGEIFTSVTDAATHFSVTEANISHILNGRQKTCKGMRFCRIADITEYLNEISANMRERETKVQAYDAIIAEQNAQRAAEEARQKAIEEHQAKVAKANEKLVRRREIVARIEEELRRAQERVAETESELNALNETEV